MTFEDCIRNHVANAVGVPVEELPCFTIVDHDGQPLTIVLHDNPGAGIYQYKVNGLVRLYIPGQAGNPS